AAVTRRRVRGVFAPAATGMSVRPAISTMRKAFGSVNSSGTLPATGVIPSIFNSGERMASSSAKASSTPGSVSMMTRDGLELVGRCPPSTGICSRERPSADKAPATTVAADDATNWRRVRANLRSESMSQAPELFRVARRLRHQLHVEVVEFFRVNIELHGSPSFVRRHLRLGVPDERFPVTGPMVHVNVDVEFLLYRDDRGIDHGRRRELIPHEAFDGVLGEVTSDRRVGFCNLSLHRWIHRSLY